MIDKVYWNVNQIWGYWEFDFLGGVDFYLVLKVVVDLIA